MSINPVCGASNYTYTITGNPGVKFTSNGLQTLTTASTSVNISISGGASENSVKAKSNFSNNVSSAQASASLTAGSPPPKPITVLLADAATGKIQVESDPELASAPNGYKWYKDGVWAAPWSSYTGNFAQIPITRGVCDVGYTISATHTTACGVSPATTKGVFVPCDNSFTVAPNPASSSITVSQDDSKKQPTANSTFDEVKIYDFQGILKMDQKYNSVASASISIANLTNGTYYVEVTNGTYKETHQILIQK
jgi:hypothetical protein